MKAKDRITIYVCTNASGKQKVPLAVIGAAKNPRCFRGKQLPVTYFQQNRAWSDQRVMALWFSKVFLRHVRQLTGQPVALIMDNCSGHGELIDPRNQVKVICLPPNCTARRQPMDQGIIAALKVRYRTALLSQRIATLRNRAALRAALPPRRAA
ncbi:unnamed protein product [Phaeothamnion confervicola]